MNSSSASPYCRGAALAILLLAGVAESGAVTVTSKGDSGAGTLRAAVAGAVAGDTIVFAAGVTGKITLTTGQITINKPLTITGPGSSVLTVSASGTSRIFVISDGSGTTDSPVTISGLTLADGYTGNCTGVQVLNNGGALTSTESFTLNDVVVRDSFAAANGGGIAFGATRAGQSVTITNSAVLGNWAGCSGATTTASGGGVSLAVDGAADPAATATVLIQDTLIENNISVRHGAGLRHIATGSATLRNVRIRGNTAGGFGGGVAVIYSNSPLMNALPTLLIDLSEISGNSAASAGAGGGGVAVFNDLAGAAQVAGSGSALTLRNSTVSGNHSRSGPGAGISAYGNVALVVQNSTVAANKSLQALAVAPGAGGVYRQIGVQNGTATANTEGTVAITSSILANNLGISGNEDLGQNGTETFANVIVLNSSLVRAMQPMTPAPSAMGNILNQDPLLGALANNGGPTSTHALGTGSPAIDAGTNPSGSTTDQRGLARTVGIAPDIGAVESGNTVSPGCLDADGNGNVDALTDGLLILRAMFGLTGTPVTSGTVGAGATRATWSVIRGYLNGNCGSSFAP